MNKKYIDLSPKFDLNSEQLRCLNSEQARFINLGKKMCINTFLLFVVSKIALTPKITSFVMNRSVLCESIVDRNSICKCRKDENSNDNSW